MMVALGAYKPPWRPAFPFPRDLAQWRGFPASLVASFPSPTAAYMGLLHNSISLIAIAKLNWRRECLPCERLFP